MTKDFNRRVLLRGLGGDAVAAPFLPTVAEREAKAQSTTATIPKRLIVMFTHYGCLTTRWFPKKSHGELTATDYMSTSLKSLAPFASKILMPRGIRAMNEWSFGGTLGQTTDPHTQVVGSFFSCYPVTPSDGKFTATPTGRTLDHVVAEQINPTSPTPLFVQVGGVNNSAQAAISYDKPNQMFGGIGSASQMFANLTKIPGFTTGGTPTADTYKLARGKSIIDIVRDDLTNLQRVNMGKSDQDRLKAWVDLLRDVSGKVIGTCNQDTATKLMLTTSGVDAAQKAAGSGIKVDITKVVNVMADITTLTALCDSNRVIFLKYPGAYTFSNLGLTKDAHGISHRIGDANMGGTCLDGVFDMIAKIDTWYAEQFAYLVNSLNSIDEGSGKVLDNTATVWFQEMSDGNSHNLNNLPIVHAGSCGGYFKTGQAVNVEDGSATMTVGNSEGECSNGKTASNLDSVGTPSNVATQPINKYFCNLMNAVGVKAGTDGFPLKGGTAEVTKYGKYDDSKSFNSTAAATIKNPGEFKQLRSGM